MTEIWNDVGDLDEMGEVGDVGQITQTLTIEFLAYYSIFYSIVHPSHPIHPVFRQVFPNLERSLTLIPSLLLRFGPQTSHFIPWLRYNERSM